jgi:hypothetical protein
MYLEILRSAALERVLLRTDEDLLEKARAGGCECSGRLHRADYPRKPRGPSAWVLSDKRFSLCCATEGCRRRCTPPSVRFLGRRVWLGAVVVLGTAMLHGLNPRRVAELHRLLGVSLRTLRRWRRWWLEAFVRTGTWRELMGRVPGVAVQELPRSLVERFLPPVEPEPIAMLLRSVSTLSARESRG